MQQESATRTFLGDEATWPDARITLDDIQAMWGGRQIIVTGSAR